jgi:hypothetical protein
MVYELDRGHAGRCRVRCTPTAWKSSLWRWDRPWTTGPVPTLYTRLSSNTR